MDMFQADFSLPGSVPPRSDSGGCETTYTVPANEVDAPTRSQRTMGSLSP